MQTFWCFFGLTLISASIVSKDYLAIIKETILFSQFKDHGMLPTPIDIQQSNLNLRLRKIRYYFWSYLRGIDDWEVFLGMIGDWEQVPVVGQLIRHGARHEVLIDALANVDRHIESDPDANDENQRKRKTTFELYKQTGVIRGLPFSTKKNKFVKAFSILQRENRNIISDYTSWQQFAQNLHSLAIYHVGRRFGGRGREKNEFRWLAPVIAMLSVDDLLFIVCLEVYNSLLQILATYWHPVLKDHVEKIIYTVTGGVRPSKKSQFRNSFVLRKREMLSNYYHWGSVVESGEADGWEQYKAMAEQWETVIVPLYGRAVKTYGLMTREQYKFIKLCAPLITHLYNNESDDLGEMRRLQVKLFQKIIWFTKGPRDNEEPVEGEEHHLYTIWESKVLPFIHQIYLLAHHKAIDFKGSTFTQFKAGLKVDLQKTRLLDFDEEGCGSWLECLQSVRIDGRFLFARFPARMCDIDEFVSGPFIMRPTTVHRILQSACTDHGEGDGEQSAGYYDPFQHYRQLQEIAKIFTCNEYLEYLGDYEEMIDLLEGQVKNIAASPLKMAAGEKGVHS